LQILRYRWENFEPFFILKDGENKGKMKLLGQDISLRFGEKRCIGFFRNGGHNPCPNNIKTGYENICDGCQREDDFFPCIKCNGSTCMNSKRREECKKNNYYIYLAAFDSLLKVGISYEHRLIERLVEQGADFGAKIAFATDGKNARLLEQQMKMFLNAKDRICGKEKHATLFGNPNNAVSKIYEALDKLKNNFNLIEPEIYDLRRHYKLQNILADPNILWIKDNLEITGKTVAAKGNILIIENHTGFFSIDANSLIGRNVENI
jgi:hypothetical protein